MSVLEIISAVLLILACVFIVMVVLMQDSNQGMSQTISGTSGDNYYQKNSGRTREAKLARMTKAAAIVIFVVALLVNVITIYGWGKDSGNNNGVPAVTTSAETGEAAGDNSGTETSEAGTEGTAEAATEAIAETTGE